MAAQGIPLFVVACEPALSGYQFGLDFFRGELSLQPFSPLSGYHHSLVITTLWLLLTLTVLSL
jgi:hypothetical protein